MSGTILEFPSTSSSSSSHCTFWPVRNILLPSISHGILCTTLCIPEAPLVYVQNAIEQQVWTSQTWHLGQRQQCCELEKRCLQVIMRHVTDGSLVFSMSSPLGSFILSASDLICVAWTCESRSSVYQLSWTFRGLALLHARDRSRSLLHGLKERSTPAILTIKLAWLCLACTTKSASLFHAVTPTLMLASVPWQLNWKSL